VARITVTGSALGNALSEMLTAPDIEPGDPLSYELAKVIWLYHPLGKKLVEGPISMAQSQPREISIPDGPEDICREAFFKQWEADRCDEVIYNVCAVARAYGIASLAIVAEDVEPDVPIDPTKLHSLSIAFSVFDPLNTAGSLVLNQNPLSIDFMKVVGIAVSGKAFHRSRAVTIMHERPVYIAYTVTAFGFVGRSVFQRALFPLKSFIQSMVTDDLVVKKAGVFIATLKAAGAIIDKLMEQFAGLKRLFVQQATNGNVISIGLDEKIETLNMQNIDGAYGMARKNILENIATSADMPAILLKQETFAEGFGEGTEDSKLVAGYIDTYRRGIRPIYAFMDEIEMRRAWNPTFFKTVQAKFPGEYGSMRYEDAFYRWRNSFTAVWPSLLREPESELVKVDDVKLKAIIAVVEVYGPMLDPDNVATLLQWAQDNVNENKIMFQSPLLLDFDALAAWTPPEPVEEPAKPKPFAASDAARRPRGRKLDDNELRDLVDLMQTAMPALRATTGKANGHAAPQP
jgi:hypothetical protein